jgi:uncharacterized protein (TIGR02996 family)
MTPEEAFLQDIIEHPDDESLRLIYADWLDERSDPRGQFIRVQCELARLPTADPRRAALEARERELLAAHSEDWVRQLDLVMTWESALALFKWRLVETIAWCQGRDLDALRTPALEPATLVGRHVESDGEQVWRSPSAGERQTVVNSLANRRAKLLSECEPRSPVSDLTGGRLLLFDPDGTLSDGAALVESDGFLDVDNVPAWDTWVFYFDDRTSEETGWAPFASYLVAWVPPACVDAVDAGIRVNPEECIAWATDVETALTSRLRMAHLLS